MRQFDKVHYFHPHVENVELLSDQTTGIGAERICNFYNGTAFHEKIMDFKDGEWMKVNIESGLPGIMKSSYAYLKIGKSKNNLTTVQMEIFFDTRFWPLGSIMAKLVMKSQFRKLADSVLVGLKDHIETGQFIGKGGKLISQETLTKEEGKILVKQSI